MLRPQIARRAGAALAALLLALLAHPGSLAAAPAEPRNIAVGDELTYPAVTEVRIENQQVIGGEPTRDGRGVVLRALKPGSSKVLVRTSEGARTLDITVSERDPAILKRELDALLKNYPDVEIRVSNADVVLEGSVKSEAELHQIEEIAKRYANVRVLVSIGPSGAHRNKMVRLDIHYVQIRRRLFRKLGLNFPPSIHGGNVANFFLKSPGGGMEGVTQYSLINDLLPSLDMNEVNGFVKVQRTDTLLTENGSRATYRDGTEIRVRLGSALGTGSLEEVFFGSSLTITPHLSASSDAVSLEIAADLSHRDDAGQQDGIPGRLVDSIQTSVYVPIGQSLMIAGVQSQSMGRNTSGIPWLNRIPILGYLFGSEQKDAEGVYGVIYITPTLVEQSRPQLQKYIDKALKYFDDPGSVPR